MCAAVSDTDLYKIRPGKTIEPRHVSSNNVAFVTSLGSDKTVQSSFKLRNSKCCSVSSSTVIKYSSD